MHDKKASKLVHDFIQLSKKKSQKNKRNGQKCKLSQINADTMGKNH